MIGMAAHPPDRTFALTVAGLEKLLERITPWLLDLGSWIFGALIAFDLVILGALLTVGPVDKPVLIASGAFAIALPPAIGGFVLLRLAGDMKTVDLEQLASSAFQEVGFTVEEGSPETAEALERRRVRTVLGYSYALLAVATTLTVVGMTAALWHMALWIGASFAGAALISLGLIGRAIGTGGRRSSVWRAPSGEAGSHED